MSHTPGPWSCEIPDIGDPHSEDERGNKYWEVTPIPQRFENNEYLCITGWMSEANARLISAAPDLLDALRDLESDISERFDMEDPSTNPGIKLCIYAAREAISKATNA